MTTTPFSLLLLFLVLLGGCFGIGTASRAALRLPLPVSFGLFVRLLTGLVVTVVGYAAVATAGNTVLWLLGLVLVMLLRSIRTSSPDLLRPAPWRWPVEALFVLGVGLVITAVRLPLQCRCPPTQPRPDPPRGHAAFRGAASHQLRVHIGCRTTT